METSDWVKLAFQLVGAICVSLITAWLTVRWALNRFKSEKIWERRVSAYADVLSALGEMLVPVGAWIDAEHMGVVLSDETSNEFRERYQTALRKFESVSAMAEFLMGGETAKILIGVVDQLQQSSRNADSFYESNEAAYGIISKAVKQLTELGRRELGLEARS